RSSDSQPSGVSSFLEKFSANVRRFEKRREPLARNFCFAQYFLGPFSISYVEDERAGSVRHVNCMVAGQAKANVILGKHNVADARAGLRFVVANPKEFGQSEIRQRRIAGELNDI